MEVVQNLKRAFFGLLKRMGRIMIFSLWLNLLLWRPITDSLSYYLTSKEILQAKKVTYKNFMEIYKNTNSKVNIILRTGSKTGRDYKFIVRTFKNNGGVIDSYVLAK
ncbi:hypothetical protein [Joostella sp.]|uniref:hypothetical protein n=1 Tax=Joostella sp. TaxID=2231138 RepID=UPI003A90C3BB